MYDRGRQWWIERTAPEKWIVALWTAAFLGIIVRLLILGPASRTLYPTYRTAGLHWTSGTDLYPHEQKDVTTALFRYSPSVAAAFAPLSVLPSKAGDVVWRIVNMSVLVLGLAWFLRALAPAGMSRQLTMLFFLLMFPPAIGHLSNGQCNALVIGLILISFAAVIERRWNLAAGCMAVSCLFKLYPIAAGLLLLVVHPRRFGLRFLAALLIGLALPFVLQSTDYVLRQYELWAQYALREDRSMWNLSDTNVDLQLLFRVWLTPIGLTTYRLIEIGVGLMFAAIVWAAQRGGRPERRVLILALGLACVWMTVFGPATESPTYLLLAPSVAWGVLSSWAQPARPVIRLMMAGSYALLLSLQLLGWNSALFQGYRMHGPQPIAGLIFLAALLIEEWLARPAAAPTLLQRPGTSLSQAA
jgi:hypothetical protein